MSKSYPLIFTDFDSFKSRNYPRYFGVPKILDLTDFFFSIKFYPVVIQEVYCPDIWTVLFHLVVQMPAEVVSTGNH